MNRNSIQSKKIDLKKLCRSIMRSREQLKPFREKRRNMVMDYAGHNWGEMLHGMLTTQHKDAVNILSQYVYGMSRALVPKQPSAIISTKRKDLRASAKIMESWVNDTLKESGIDEVLREVIVDALFWVGIIKVAVYQEDDGDLYSEPGMPYACRVDPEDWFYDPSARSLSPRDLMYEGHLFRVPLESVMDSDDYGPSKKYLRSSEWGTADWSGDLKLSSAGRWNYSSDDEIVDMVDLVEVYVHSERKSYVLAWDWIVGGMPEKAEPLQEIDWTGPPDGPYHHIYFMSVPGNSSPKGPVMDLWDLHRQTNDSYKKVFEQTARSKQIVVSGGNDSDARTITEAGDGFACTVNDVDRIKTITVGQPDQLVLQMAMWTGKIFNKQAGNIEGILGLSPQAGTAKQEEIVSSGASANIKDQIESVNVFISKVYKSLCWFWWNHPTLRMEGNFTIPYSGIEVSRSLSPLGGESPNRNVPFKELSISIDPYSMVIKHPKDRLRELIDIVTKLYMPMAAVWDSQGVALDASEFWEEVGRLIGIQDFDRFVSIGTPAISAEQGGQGIPGLPSGGKRIYERVSTSGQDEGAEQRQVIEAMANARAENPEE